MSSSKPIELETSKIPLKDIILATNNFSQEHYLGGGGFGKVFKGTLPNPRTIGKAAFKRLNPESFQGKREFYNELSLLSSCDHENIIAFIGFCDEGNEMIIAYEYAENKSLDQYLKDTNKMRCISWIQRLQICIDSARGLNHLHWGLGAGHRVIHRDIKSGNILLDDRWTAKISDFGLSKFSLKNQLFTEVNTMVCGTPGYCDPYYRDTETLRKESDVYSFGVVLFEVVCGRLFHPKKIIEGDKSDDSQTVLIDLIRRHKKNLYNIIDPHIKDQIDSNSLYMFTGTAYKCLKADYKKRPTTTEIIEGLEKALSLQVKKSSDTIDWEKLLPLYYKEIIRRSNQPLVYRNNRSLYSLLCAGTFIDNEKGWFCISKLNGKNCLMAAATDIFQEAENEFVIGHESIPGTRFPKVVNMQYRPQVCRNENDEVYLIAEMLSLDSVYAVFIICKYNGKMDETDIRSSHPQIPFDIFYEKKVTKINSVEWRDDEWMEIELFHFVYAEYQKFIEIQFDLIWTSSQYGLYIDCFEFRPIDEMETDKDETEVEKYHEREPDSYWEKQLPTDYEEIVSKSTHDLRFTTKKELYSLLVTGIPIDENSMWFRLELSNGKKCVMLSATLLTKKDPCVHEEMIKDDTSRFSLSWDVGFNESLQLGGKLKGHMLSPKTYYAAWLVFKGDLLLTRAKVFLTLGQDNEKTRLVYLGSSSATMKPHCDNDPYEESISYYKPCKSKLDRRSRERDDGWYEVELFPFFNDVDVYYEVKVGLHITSTEYKLITIQGMEFRPQPQHKREMVVV